MSVSKTGGGNLMGVRFPLSAPDFSKTTQKNHSQHSDFIWFILRLQYPLNTQFRLLYPLHLTWVTVWGYTFVLHNNPTKGYL